MHAQEPFTVSLEPNPLECWDDEAPRALWEPPADDFDRDPADLLTALINELVTTTDASRR
jgi:hypothetical protein